jgi:hypothetical protein
MKLSSLGIGVAVMVVSAITQAGAYNATQTVVISATEFYGSLSAARYSSDSVQFIGCQTEDYTLSGNPYTYGQCSAVDSTGKVAYCQLGPYENSQGNASQPLADLRAVSSTSSIDVEYSYSGGQCTHISVNNDSAFLH